MLSVASPRVTRASATCGGAAGSAARKGVFDKVGLGKTIDFTRNGVFFRHQRQ
jgi:hypothetical protein